MNNDRWKVVLLVLKVNFPNETKSFLYTHINKKQIKKLCIKLSSIKSKPGMRIVIEKNCNLLTKTYQKDLLLTSDFVSIFVDSFNFFFCTVIQCMDILMNFFNFLVCPVVVCADAFCYFVVCKQSNRYNKLDSA